MNINEYKFLNKINKNNNSTYNFSLYKYINKTLISFLLLVICLCLIKTNNKYKNIIKKEVYDKNISFSKINSLYESLFGKISPLEEINKSKTKLVFDEEIIFKNVEPYKEGAKVLLESNLVPVLESGLVVYKGNKDNYGYTIIIEQVNGVDLWYVGLNESNIKLYEYLSKNDILGEVNEKYLYLFFQKDGKFIDYKEYIK